MKINEYKILMKRSLDYASRSLGCEVDEAYGYLFGAKDAIKACALCDQEVGCDEYNDFVQWVDELDFGEEDK